MTEALKKQVFEWIVASRILSKKEIWNLVENTDELILSNFVKIVKPGKGRETSLPSPVEDDEPEFEEKSKNIPTLKVPSGGSNGNEIKDKDQHANVKFMLEQAGPTALKYRQAPTEKVVDMSTVKGIAQYVSFKFEKISFGNHI